MAMIKDQIVHELRQMFLDGATPSRLMLHIQTHHSEDEPLHFLITDYFKEAFKLPLIRCSSGKDFKQSSLEHDHFNRDLVHEMVCRIDEWSSEALDGTWLENTDGLWTHSHDEHKERLKTAEFEELDRVWNTLNEKERLFIIRKIAHRDYLWYKVKTLSRLVERLQQKILELETHVGFESNSKHP